MPTTVSLGVHLPATENPMIVGLASPRHANDLDLAIHLPTKVYPTLTVIETSRSVSSKPFRRRRGLRPTIVINRGVISSKGLQSESRGGMILDVVTDIVCGEATIATTAPVLIRTVAYIMILVLMYCIVFE